jgi:serine protease Do
MNRWIILVMLGMLCGQAAAEPSHELFFQLKASVVKVITSTKSGGQGVGTGVVVGQDYVATSCHVLANSNGITIRKMGENHSPVAIKADWKHDICLLRFQGLPLTPVPLGDSENLQYEQPVFSIGFPGGVPKPQVTTGKIKALYALDDSRIIRTSTSFIMGASGSPLLDDSGKLIGVSTFKSPGRNAYFYNVPVTWLKKLLDAPERSVVQQEDLPFWDAPEEMRPFFMRVVPPLLAERWYELEQVAALWVAHEPTSPEAWHYLGLAQDRQSRNSEAMQQYQKVLAINPQHPATLFEMGMMASRAGDRAEVAKMLLALNEIDEDMAEELRRATGDIH